MAAPLSKIQHTISHMAQEIVTVIGSGWAKVICQSKLV